jgi:NAD(P)H-dependent flavin oxidoreductase YrpB (nitropropane dioxygenase family)
LNPWDVIEKCHEHDIKVAAGGHTREIASMVLTPDIVDAVGADVPVLGAVGIGSGRQIAASLALGAQGVWTGAIWLGTEEHRSLASNQGRETAFTRATSSDTVRTRIYTGQAGSAAQDEVDRGLGEEGAPEPLPMPLQNLLVAEAHNRINASHDPDVIRCPSARSSAG